METNKTRNLTDLNDSNGSITCRSVTLFYTMRESIFRENFTTKIKAQIAKINTLLSDNSKQNSGIPTYLTGKMKDSYWNVGRWHLFCLLWLKSIRCKWAVPFLSIKYNLISMYFKRSSSIKLSFTTRKRTHKTRMHSNRMRTTSCSGCLFCHACPTCHACPLPPCIPRHTCPQATHANPPTTHVPPAMHSPCGQTNTYENITFANFVCV